MSRTIRGEAKRLSVGMSKKPWIWAACRSSVMTRSTPACGDQIGDQLGRDRGAGAGTAVLPRIAEIGDHSRDAVRRGAAQRVGDDQELHQMVVGRKRGRLQDEGVRAADVLLDLDEDFHVGEAANHALGQRQAEPVGDRLCKRRVGVAGDQLDRAVLGRHRGFSPDVAGDLVQHIGFPWNRRFDERGNIRDGSGAGNPRGRVFPGKNGCHFRDLTNGRCSPGLRYWNHP